MDIDLPEPTPASYSRIIRFSLADEKEKAAIEEARVRFENKDQLGLNNKHGSPGPPFPFGPPPGFNNKNGPPGPPFPSGPPPDGKFGAPFIDDPNAPKDKGHVVLLVICLFGLVHMLPMMFLMTANEYWMYKFRNVTLNTTDANERTYYQINLASFTKLTVTAPGVICNLIAAFSGHKIRAQTRVFAVLFIHSCVLIANTVFVQINTDSWQGGFFIVTLGLQLIMSMAMSLGGSGSMGLIAKLPPRYMKAQLMGEGGSGVFSALLRLVSIVTTPSTIAGALLYFITGSVLMVITSTAFYFATKTPFFKYYTRHAKEERKQKIRNLGDFKAVLKIQWPLILLSFLPMIFPTSSFTTLVVSEFNGTYNIWGSKYFVTVCTYLIPALCGLLGRGVFNYLDYDCSIPMLYVLSLSREAVFGALTVFSNALPRHHLPVLLKHDWQYGLMMAGNSLTSGFMMNLSMIKSLKMSPKDRIELSMMCNMFFMSIAMVITSPLGVVVNII